MYCGVLTSGIAVVDRIVERVALSGTEGYSVAQRALDEAGVFNADFHAGSSGQRVS
jgi:hypothetical protein